MGNFKISKSLLLTFFILFILAIVMIIFRFYYSDIFIVAIILVIICFVCCPVTLIEKSRATKEKEILKQQGIHTELHDKEAALIQRSVQLDIEKEQLEKEKQLLLSNNIKYCKYCGNKMAENTNSCPSCGVINKIGLL